MESDAVAAMIAAQHNLRLDPEMAQRGLTLGAALRTYQFACLVPILAVESDDRASIDPDQLFDALMSSVSSS
jgi:hypothetical protein